MECVRYKLSIGAMEERSRKFQKASTHEASCVAMDVAARHGHSAANDVDATALHPEKETSIQRGDGGSVQDNSDGERVLCPEDQVGGA